MMLSTYLLTFFVFALSLIPTYASPCSNSRRSTSSSQSVTCYGKRSSDVAVLTSLSSRMVYNPHIEKPAEGDEWKVGSRVRVVWDTNDMPDKGNPEGKLLLGYIEPGSANEHLDLEHPLAESFPIADGSIDIAVPPVKERDNYIVVLMGDSGNRSGAFRISA